jgi:hypothetical protein
VYRRYVAHQRRQRFLLLLPDCEPGARQTPSLSQSACDRSRLWLSEERLHHEPASDGGDAAMLGQWAYSSGHISTVLVCPDCPSTVM